MSHWSVKLNVLNISMTCTLIRSQTTSVATGQNIRIRRMQISCAIQLGYLKLNNYKQTSSK